MPDYYSGANPENAFASGMMAGYDFIDRLKARKDALDLEKRNQARQDEAFAMTKEEVRQQQIDRETNRTTAAYQLERDKTIDTREDRDDKDTQEQLPTLRERARRGFESDIDTAKANQDQSKAATEASRASLAAIAETRVSGKLYADMLQRRGRAGSLGEIAEQGTAAPMVGQGTVLRPEYVQQQQQAAAGAAPPATTVPPAAAAPAAAPTRSPDLRVAQAEMNKLPNRLVRAGNAVQGVVDKVVAAKRVDDTGDFWRIVANPEDNDSINPIAGYGGGNLSKGLFGAKFSDVRENFDKYAPAYIQDRPNVAVADRTRLDATAEAVFKQQEQSALAQLRELEDSGGPSAAPKIRALINQQNGARNNLDALYKAQADTAFDGTKKPVDTTAPGALAVAAGVREKRAETGVMSTMTIGEYRAGAARLSRMSNLREADPEDAKIVSRFFAAGGISEATLNNHALYGSPVAPPEMKPIRINDRIAVLMTPNGPIALKFPGGSDADEAKGKERVGVLMNKFSTWNESDIAAKHLKDPKGSGSTVAKRMMLTLQNRAIDIQKKTGIRLIGADGEVTLQYVTELDEIRLHSALVDHENGVDTPGDTVNPPPEGDFMDALMPAPLRQ